MEFSSPLPSPNQFESSKNKLKECDQWSNLGEHIIWKNYHIKSCGFMTSNHD